MTGGNWGDSSPEGGCNKNTWQQKKEKNWDSYPLKKRGGLNSQIPQSTKQILPN